MVLDINSKTSAESRLEKISKDNKRPWAKQKKKLESLTMTNSDEEQQLELTNALRLHKRNKKKKGQLDKNKSGEENPVLNSKNTEEGSAEKTQRPCSNSDEETSIQYKNSDGFISEEALRKWLCGHANPEGQSKKVNDIENVTKEINLPDEKNASLDIDEMLNFFFPPQKTCIEHSQLKHTNPKEAKSLVDYEKQGAIPKNKCITNSKENLGINWENQINKKSKKKPVKSAEERTANSLEGEKKKRAKQFSDEDSKGDNFKCLKPDKNVFSQPFFYIVPENPSPDFFVPQGSYYVVPKELDSFTVVVLHPEKNSILDNDSFLLKRNLELSGYENDLAQPAQRSTNNSEMNVSLVSDTGLNISLINEIERRLSEDVLEKSEPNELLAMKSALTNKLNEANLKSIELLHKLCLVEICLNLENTFSSMKSFHHKEISRTLSFLKKEDHFSKLVALFPKTDKIYLREKMEECCGRQDLLENFIETECQRLATLSEELDEGLKLLLQELPNYEFGFLYELWNDSCGDKDAISEFIQLEKEADKVETLIQSLILEFPYYEEAILKNIAQLYLHDEEGLAAFIAAEHLNRKVQHQFVVMTSALPDSDAAELQKKCIEFQGDEEKVQEYIRKVELENLIKSKILNMQLILPDADPDFLRREVEKLDADNDAVNNLIDNLLESQNYPKYVPDKESAKRRRLWQIYVNNFNVKEFLYKVPKPEKFADNAGDNNKADWELILKFLQSRYPVLPPLQLREFFINQNSNITKTCLMLDQTEEPIRLAFSEFCNEAFDEVFLQEICYIDFKKEIDKFLVDMETIRIIEAEEARLNNAFLTCPLCQNEELIPSEAAVCPDGHIFCKDCISRYVDVKLGDGLYKFPCFSEGCETYFTYETVEELLPKSLLSKIVRKQQAAEICEANVDGLETCPYCEYSCIPNPEDNIFMCQNPDCLMDTCRKCREKSHVPLRCEEIERPKDLEARKKIEETMTEKLVRVCLACGKKFIKLDGCNKMTCPCGAVICYICRQLVNGYNHFKDKNPESKCPLYSNNDDLHTREVLEEGIRVRDDILQENPEIRIIHDPTVTHVYQSKNWTGASANLRLP